MNTSLQQEHEALLQFLYLAPVGLVQTRLDGEIVMINPLCAQLLIPLASGSVFTNLYDALGDLVPDLRSRVDHYAGSSGMVCEALHLPVFGDPRRPATNRRILALTVLKLGANGLMAVLTDVTNSVQRDRELRQSQAWINTIAIGLTDYALTTLDGHGRVSDWTSSVARITGFDDAASIGQPYSIFYPSDAMDAAAAIDRLHEADCSGWSLDEGWRRRADGSRYWGSCLIAPLHEAGETRIDERAYSLVIRDVSDRRESTEALRRSVACDQLTGLANRRALCEAFELELERWRREPRPLSMLLVDADHFKRINADFGHAVGDAVLRHLASVLHATFREADLVARLGGEEFVVLLPGVEMDAAAALAERLCLTIGESTVSLAQASVRYTVSVGVATMDAALDDVEAFIRRADVAMHQAKAAGRNRVERWSPGLRSAVALAPA